MFNLFQGCHEFPFPSNGNAQGKLPIWSYGEDGYVMFQYLASDQVPRRMIRPKPNANFAMLFFAKIQPKTPTNPYEHSLERGFETGMA